MLVVGPGDAPSEGDVLATRATDLGNPFTMLGVDQTGRAAINWGVYGVPESYLIGKDGTILWKQTGPFTPESVRNGLLPEIEKALAAN